MDRFCRGCLVRYDEPAELLRYTEKNRRLFVYCTGLQVKRNDAFTFQLCKDCYLSMKMSCNFKKQCRTSDKKFKSYSALKETNETMDLSTYLKHNDDSWTYKFPTFRASSTPAHQQAKEDDSESTSTSIRNFMTDIMPDADLPETEARIIREVIEEEADVLDDSLDSHWLQDDASIDTNFRLDFSFSPFSTPRPVNNDKYTPKILAQTKPVEKTPDYEPCSGQTNKVLDMPILNEDSTNAILPDQVEQGFNYDEKIDTLDAVNDILRADSENLNNVDKVSAQQSTSFKHIKDVLQNSDSKDDKIYSAAVKDILNYGHEVGINTDQVPVQQCTIDKNLEEALKNSCIEAFSLDALLISPKVIPGVETPPTPLINNILFGAKLDMDDISNKPHKYTAVPGIQSYLNEGDTNMSEFDIDIKIESLGGDEIRTEKISEDETDKEMPSEGKQSGVTNFYCKMCHRSFETLRSMKRHADLHTRKVICDICARAFNDKTNLSRHIKTHMREPPGKYECETCQLQFSSERTLSMHTRAHSGVLHRSSPKKKFMRYMCAQCTFATDKSSNFRLHMMRHEKVFTFNCLECDKGFYRKADLTIHMRRHTGEKPFLCTFCDRKFVRVDGLTRHIKTHLHKPFKCEFCKEQFINSTNLKNHHKKSKRCRKRRDEIANDQSKINEEPSHFVTVALIGEDNQEECMSAPEKNKAETPKCSPLPSET